MGGFGILRSAVFGGLGVAGGLSRLLSIFFVIFLSSFLDFLLFLSY